MLPKVISVVMCDDLRKEITGKDILIGVYGGSINVASYPTHIQVAIWMELEVPEIGQFPGHIKIETPSGNPPIDVRFNMEVKEGNTGIVALAGLPVALERDGDIIISAKFGSGEMTEVRRKLVQRVAQIYPAAHPHF